MMKHRGLNLLFGLALVHGLALSGSAQTLSSYQSTLQPLGLSLIGKTTQTVHKKSVTGNVYTGSTDTASATYASSYQASFLNVVASELPEGVAFTSVNNQLDPKRLYFAYDYHARVYFLSEGACYLDALGVTITSATAPTSNPPSGQSFSVGASYTVFPLGQYWNATVSCGGPQPTRQSTSYPLLPGDFVELGTVSAGQQLAFFLMANMISGVPTNTYYNGSSNNGDSFQHMIAFFPDSTSQYLIIGFEDEWAGAGGSCDKDCNDIVFVVDVGQPNATAMRNASSMPSLPQ